MHESAMYLVIGGGIAGLSFALRVAEHEPVAVITKNTFDQSNTWWAQGGVAAAVAADDSVANHIQDTLIAGAGLSHPDVVARIIGAGPELIADLADWGIEFSGGADGYDLGREGGHSQRRVLHIGDITGAELGAALLARAKAHPNISLYEGKMAIDLITQRRKLKSFEDRCLGAYVLDTKTGEIEPWLARATVLATGGSGKVYLYTSNPDVATGDGVAMAYRAGCRVANMEFTQFHPTCLYHPEAKNFLISEAVRGEGGVLLNAAGERFMLNVHPLAELAPRDVVARAIDAEMKRTGADNVWLDISHKPAEFVRQRFPNLVAACARFGFDMTAQPIPVVPAAHYQCGGVWTDSVGRTQIPCLFALGEVAFTGLHGANRLASNSLLEGLAMAKFAAEHVLANPPPPLNLDPGLDLAWHYGDAVPPDDLVVVAHNWDELRRTMSRYVGIVRTDRRLERARRRVATLAEEVSEYYWGAIPNQDILELRNIVQVAWLIIESARRRRESRGLHTNLDVPETLPVARDTVIDPINHYP